MDPFTVISGGLLVVLAVMVLLLGAFSRRSPREYLDWKPARSLEAQAQDELDDVAQMVAAQNALRRRRGAGEISAEDVERRVREDQEELRRWRAS